MTDMIERVARALAECDGLTICSDASYRMSSYGIRAIAAIKAMREPSDEMLGEAHDTLLYSVKGEELGIARAVWSHMIDAALGAEDEQ